MSSRLRCCYKASCDTCSYLLLLFRAQVKSIKCTTADGEIDVTEALVSFYDVEHAAEVRTCLAESQV
jgi:hypothetical protein